MQTNIQPIVGINQQLIVCQRLNKIQPMVVNTDQSKKNFAARLDKALTYAGIPPDRRRIGRVAKMFEVSKEAVRKWLAGESIPDTKRISDISRKTGVRGEWLLTEQGPMHYGDNCAEEGGHEERFPPHVLQLARLIAQAPPEKVQAILVLLGEQNVDPTVQHEEVAKGKHERKIRVSPHVVIKDPKKPRNQVTRKRKESAGRNNHD
jgi:hypothetical protein